VCNREAPGVEQFAQRIAPKLTVVGLGTQDSLAKAQAFVTKYKMTSTRMFWDRSGDTWTAYGVPGQPAALLIRDGVVVKSWTGPLDEAAVEAALA
jgi:peroxiredoxin